MPAFYSFFLSTKSWQRRRLNIQLHVPFINAVSTAANLQETKSMFILEMPQTTYEKRKVSFGFFVLNSWM